MSSKGMFFRSWDYFGFVYEYLFGIKSEDGSKFKVIKDETIFNGLLIGEDVNIVIFDSCTIYNEYKLQFNPGIKYYDVYFVNCSFVDENNNEYQDVFDIQQILKQLKNENQEKNIHFYVVKSASTGDPSIISSISIKILEVK